MSVNYCKTPWPWFGGKADAAPHVWEALGDVQHYVEPFAGSLAVLLRRPHPCNRGSYNETVNDLDGLICNAWRSIQLSPDATADAASWPVCEADLHARHLALLTWRSERQLEHLMADPAWHDPIMGGWWMWGQSCWIGSGWCSGKGPWIVGADGCIAKRDKRRGEGVNRQLPHLADDGKGVNRPVMRDPGVAHGMEYHQMTMPELRHWMRFLSARLRHVRIINGDWSRAVTNGASKTIEVRYGGHCGIFLDPPYSDAAERSAGLYAVDDLNVGHAVREWALKRGVEEDTRIVLAGFDGEHNVLEDHGWTSVEWFRDGALKGGYANQGKNGHQQRRERLWLSPHCLRPVAKPAAQVGLFE